MLMYHNIDGCLSEIDNIQEDIHAIKKWVKRSAEYYDEDATYTARYELLEWCKQLMGDSCELYKEIEKRFGIDVYND